MSPRAKGTYPEETYLRNATAAAAFVRKVGMALVFPEAGVPLPSLWEAAVGDTQVTVFEVDLQGRRTLTPELVHVWALKNQFAERRLAVVGKHLRRRLAAISLQTLPALYARPGRTGRLVDFRNADDLSPLECEIAELLLERGPQTAQEVRRMLRVREVREVKRRLEALERLLIVTRAGEKAQAAGWDAALFDLTARRYAEHLADLPDEDEARLVLAATVIRATGPVSLGQIAKAVGLTRVQTRIATEELVAQGLARQRGDVFSAEAG